MHLCYLSADLEAFDVTFGFEVVVGETVTHCCWFTVGEVEGSLVEIGSIGVGLLHLADESHQFLSFATWFVLL